MNKQLFALLFLVVFTISCVPDEEHKSISIDENLLLRHVEILSNDSLEGRLFGTVGHKKTQHYIAEYFDSLGLTPAFDSSYYQPFSITLKGEKRNWLFPVSDYEDSSVQIPDTTITGANIVAIKEGLTEKALLITAHYDHLGMRNGEIYNGADDNASGVAALLTIAEYFRDKSLNHTLILAAIDAEEIELEGSYYLSLNFPIDINNVVLNINMDMISKNDSMELYAAGTFHYPHLKLILNQLKSPINLKFGHDDPSNNELTDWTDASDHTPFHDQGIPFIYFAVEDHPNYHQPSDTFDNINHDFYIEAVKLIIQAVERFDVELKEEK
ncbi:M28 family peptidase [Fulvivirga lutea]|uniref:M28 family peptidase n=1 Tax=Fulvivirga lutea TaxID=2810512 RepID=A0A974WE95_9BACT|nr:M28 family peptidase [Fulvivirga lutea]QSE96165.1 M28 family peptidase [Fulvivirga lutea]